MDRKKFHTLKEWSQIQNDSFLQRALVLQERARLAKSAAFWGVFQVVLLSVLLSDLNDDCTNHNIFVWLLEYALVCISGVWLIKCLLVLLRYCLTKPLQGTKAQKRLLNFADDDSSFIIQNDEKRDNNSANSLKKFKDDILNWSISSRNATRASSRSYSHIMANQSSKRLNSTMNSSGARNTSYNSNSSFDLSRESAYVNRYEEQVFDAKGFQQYLRKFEEHSQLEEEEQLLTRATNFQPTHSFWNYYSPIANMLRSTVYQMSPPVASNSPHHKHGSREDIGMGFIDGNSEIIQKLSSERLARYVTKLRVWIAATILHRVVQQITDINEVFKHRGFHDMRIGNASLDRLKKTVENHHFINTFMPKLPMLLPFLNMFNNQEYLVQRIKDLASGNCISEYRWNSGGTYHGQKWDKHLPTDAAIIFHLFCVYMDSQLIPLPQGDSRPFYSRYVVLADEKRLTKTILESVKNKANCAILCSNFMHPKFNFISEQEIHNAANDRYNLFYVIIQFLTHIKTHHDSSLEGVNLGKSGINIMSVIES